MKKFFKIFFLILLITTLSFSFLFRKKIFLTYTVLKDIISLTQNPDSYNHLDFNSTETMTYKDIVYKDTNNKELSLDIYSPSKQIYKTSPVLLYVHGGSWVYGDKTLPEAISPILDIFRDNGFTIISTSYELMNKKENFKKQVCDVKDTIRWIYKNANNYNLNPNEIGLIGMSSGAHLSLMSAYTSNDEFQDDPELSKFPSNVKYVIDFFGPTDLNLLDTSNLNWDLNNVFQSVKSKNDVLSKFNPINFVNSDIPKTLIIHSKTDGLVPYNSSLNLYNKCIEVDGSAQLLTLENTAHNMSQISSNDITNLSKETLKFILLNSPLS